MNGEVSDALFHYEQRIFLAIPAISAITFLPAFFTSHQIQVKLMCMLSVSSLIATAYILIFVPNAQSEPSNSRQPRQVSRFRYGPIRQYINLLNGALALLIAMNVPSLISKQGVHEGFWLLCLLPFCE